MNKFYTIINDILNDYILMALLFVLLMILNYRFRIVVFHILRFVLFMEKLKISQNEARKLAQQESRRLDEELARNTEIVELREIIEKSLKRDDSGWSSWVKEIETLSCWEFVLGGHNSYRGPLPHHTVISVNMYTGEVKSLKR